MIDTGYEWETPGTSAYGKIEHRIVFNIQACLKDEPELDRWLLGVNEPPARPHSPGELPGGRPTSVPSALGVNDSSASRPAAPEPRE